MTEHTQTDTDAGDRPGHRGRFGVEFARSVTDAVTAYYDVEVTAPIDASEADIRQQGAEAVADAVDGDTPDDLTEAHQWLEAVSLGDECRSDVPPELETITFSESIRYEHEGVTCEGHLFEVDSEADLSPPTVLVLAETIDGAATDETVVHHVEVTAITACLDGDTAEPEVDDGDD